MTICSLLRMEALCSLLPASQELNCPRPSMQASMGISKLSCVSSRISLSPMMDSTLHSQVSLVHNCVVVLLGSVTVFVFLSMC